MIDSEEDSDRIRLWRVEGKTFICGVVLLGSRIIHTAPSLRWSFGMRAQQARKSFRRKKWKIIVLEDTWNDLQAAVRDYEGLFDR